MRKFTLLAMAAVFALFSANADADDIFKIQVGSDYQNYSNADLQRRVWQLERAVWQLQQRVFQLEAQPQQPVNNWVCTVDAMGTSYTGTGPSQAMASAAAIDHCQRARSGDGFFCKNPKCSQ